MTRWWVNFILFITSTGLATFIYFTRKALLTDIDAREESPIATIEKYIWLGLELFDMYKDTIRTIYFAHTNRYAVFVLYFSLTGPFTMIYLEYEEVTLTFVLALGMQEFFPNVI